MWFLLQISFVAGISLCQSTLVSDEVIEKSARIVNGYEVDITEVPYQASLRRKVTTGLAHICGAVILKNRVILTAAHCVDAYSYDPALLKAVVGTKSRASGGKSYDVSTIFVHEDYSQSTMINDIALLGTAKSITFSDSVRPISYAPSDLLVLDGAEAIVSGFGATSYDGPSSSALLAARVQIVNHNICLRAYLRMATVTPEMICAGGSDPDRDACQGDSGGPLVSNDHLIGIVSWGEGCANNDYPGVYTRISKYHDWIEMKIKQLYG